MNKDLIRSGPGTYTSVDGATYVGEFKEGKYHGQGTLTYCSGGEYVGEFKDGARSGQGTLTHSDGTTYVGEFKDGSYHGQGESIRPRSLKGLPARHNSVLEPAPNRAQSTCHR